MHNILNDEMKELYYNHMMQHCEEIRENRIQDEQSKIKLILDKIKACETTIVELLERYTEAKRRLQAAEETTASDIWIAKHY